MFAVVERQCQFAVENVDKCLGGSGIVRTVRTEFDRILKEAGAARWGDVDDRRGIPHPWQRRAHECVGRVQEVIVPVSAACKSEVLH